VLVEPERRPRIWREHDAILTAILDGDAAAAERLARRHTSRAREETAERLPAAAVA
jgi:DNA-binding GntR family transcriptional regulator